MGYTDTHGRPEIRPAAWFGNSPTQLRRSSRPEPAPTEGGTTQPRDGRAAGAADAADGGGEDLD